MAASASAPMDRSPVSSAVPAAIVLFEPEAGLLQALLARLTQDGSPLFIFVNGPLEAAAEAALATAPDASVIRSATNRGQSAGLNAVVEAADEAGFSHLLLFDQDSTPEAGLGRALMARFRELEGAGGRLAVLGPRLTPPRGSTYLPIVYWRRAPRAGEPVGAVDFVPTSGSLISIAAWRAIGPFREDYFIAGIDVEWGYRAWSRGFASAVADDIMLTHRWGHEDSPQAKLQKQILRQPGWRIYYYIRNAVHGMTLSHMPWRWKARQAVRMAAQIGLLLAARRREVPASLLRQAIADGWAGRLGPFAGMPAA